MPRCSPRSAPIARSVRKRFRYLIAVAWLSLPGATASFGGACSATQCGHRAALLRSGFGARGRRIRRRPAEERRKPGLDRQPGSVIAGVLSNLELVVEQQTIAADNMADNEPPDDLTDAGGSATVEHREGS